MKDTIEDQARVFVGAYPHHGGSNICKGDGWYSAARVREHGEDKWWKAVRRVSSAWDRHVAAFQVEEQD